MNRLSPLKVDTAIKNYNDEERKIHTDNVMEIKGIVAIRQGGREMFCNNSQTT